MTKFEEQLKKLDELGFPKGEYAIFGSGPMAVRGIRDTNDLDLIVTAKLWKELTEKYGVQVFKDGTNFIEIGNIEIWKSWWVLQQSVEELIQESEVINDLPFVKLKYVLEWKKGMHRKKDLKDIEILEKML